MEDILLHYSGVALIAAETILDYMVEELAFWDGQVFFFVKIVLHEDFLDPGIPRKCLNMVKAEKADAVCDLLSDAVESGEIFHGLPVVQNIQMIQIQITAGGISTEPVDIFGAVAQL